MKDTKKVLLYSPYLDILGGGEKHILSILKVFDDEEYDINVAWDDPNIGRKISTRLHIKFSNLTFIPNFLKTHGRLSRLKELLKYDYFFYVTDGSYFFSQAKKNYIFAMYPKKDLYNMKFVNRLKLFNFSVISNSEFTAKYIDRWFGKKPKVIYPFIDEVFLSISEKKLKKQKIILTVGRFFEHLHSKRQDVLIKSFKKLKQTNKNARNFKLVIAGGLKEKEDEFFLKKLQIMVKERDDISFLINPSFNKLFEIYKKSSIYWHAAGFGVDELTTPEKVEHLGITPLEAMASQCFVFCHDSGGPKRYIRDGETGFLYHSINELVEKTSAIIDRPDEKIIKKATAMIHENFSYKSFRASVKDYFNI